MTARKGKVPEGRTSETGACGLRAFLSIAQGGDQPLRMDDQAEGLYDVRDDQVGLFQYGGRAALISHDGYADGRFFQHLGVVRAVPDGDYLLGAQPLTTFAFSSPLAFFPTFMNVTLEALNSASAVS